MATSNSHGLVDAKEYQLTIGATFQPQKKQDAFYTMRYDFKPASIDCSRDGEVVIGRKNECTVTIPNHDSGVTTYKGGKKPCTKECVLIINKRTGEMTLERISSNIPLKKHRVDRSVEQVAKLSQAKPLSTTSLSKPLKSNATSKSVSKSSSNASAVKASLPVIRQQVNKSPISSQYLVKTSSPSKQINSNSNFGKQQLGHNSNVHNSLTSTVAQFSELEMVKHPRSTTSDSASSTDSSDSESDLENNSNSDETVMIPYQPPPPPMTSATGDINLVENTHPSDLSIEDDVSNNSAGTKEKLSMSTLHNDLQLSDSNSDSE